MTETTHVGDRATPGRCHAVDVLTRKLLEYFAALGGPKGHIFELRDINLQVMMNVYAPAERALLEVVIEELLQDGGLRRVSATSYSLTDEGIGRVRRVRHASMGAAASDRPPYHEGAGLHGVGDASRRRGLAARPSA